VVVGVEFIANKHKRPLNYPPKFDFVRILLPLLEKKDEKKEKHIQRIDTQNHH
jgi:hypothetical protein